MPGLLPSANSHRAFFGPILGGRVLIPGAGGAAERGRRPRPPRRCSPLPFGQGGRDVGAGGGEDEAVEPGAVAEGAVQ